MAAFLFVFILFTACHSGGECVLQLASYFSSQMVLQRAPQQAVLWGTADTEGDTVTVRVSGQPEVTSTVSQGQWKVALPAVAAGGPYEVTVVSTDGQVTLSDVLFGDVWLCSGQSNMVFTMDQVINSTEEIERAAAFSEIRFTKATMVKSPTPLDTMQFDFPWSTPTSPNLGDFSGLCFLFGEYLQPRINSPVGLVQSAWGGTAIELWSDPAAIADCSSSNSENSYLWNAMINPLRSATITGALWYQGESNAGRADLYSCQIQAMVREWRAQFFDQSLQQTSDQFPFGYVQLAGNADNDEVGTFPEERWAQTANYGYNPNPAMPNTFMAVAMDLPDFDSPYGTIHPRYKQDIAERLMLGALNVAYGDTTVPFQGPFPSSLSVDDEQQTLTIVYDDGQAELEDRSQDGFEVCCTERPDVAECDETQDTWVAATITSVVPGSVTLSTSGCGNGRAVGMRYEWRTSPCELKACTLYSAAEIDFPPLPAPPYITRSIPRL